MKIYLVSIAGYPNYGDELIIKNWVELLRGRYPDAEIWVDVPTPTIIQCYFEGKNIYVTNAIWRLIWETPFDSDFDTFSKAIENKIVNLGTPYIDIPLSKLKNVDFFHIVGGGYINKIWEKHVGLLISGAVIKKISGCRSYLTGGGFLPLLDDTDKVRSLFSQFDYVESRDIVGHELLNLNLGFDDAYLNYLNQWGNYEDREIPDVMVCIQHDMVDEVVFRKTIEEIRIRLHEYREKSLSIGYLEAIPGQDRIAFEELKDCIDESMFFPAAASIINGLPLKKNQIWYSTRFHHHLVVSMYELKGVCLSLKKDYYNVKHRSLLQNGTGWSYWEGIGELPYPTLDREFGNKIKHIVSEKRRVATHLYPVVVSKATVLRKYFGRIKNKIRRILSIN